MVDEIKRIENALSGLLGLVWMTTDSDADRLRKYGSVGAAVIKMARDAMKDFDHVKESHGEQVLNADQVVKLLDRGAFIVMFKNGLGSYTSAVLSESKPVILNEVDEMNDMALTLTDDFTPGRSLHRLSEKMLRTGSSETGISIESH